MSKDLIFMSGFITIHVPISIICTNEENELYDDDDSRVTQLINDTANEKILDNLEIGDICDYEIEDIAGITIDQGKKLLENVGIGITDEAYRMLEGK